VRLRRASGGAHALVLCLHAITDEWPHALATGPAALEEQLSRLLGKGFEPATAADVVVRRGRLLHVTFDDAFASVERALPLLDRLGLPATVFACSGYASDGRPLDVPELAEDAQRYPDELRTMNWDALRGLAERGIEIGSHTISHPHLPLLGDVEVQRELRESRKQIEDELQRPCRFVAYPFGDEDARIRAASAAAGYEAAFGLPGREDWSDRHALPRVGVYSS
jgi:peptidoglycan/xylan/chitin deacetylase (PgdA/CDA1 family)